MNSAKTFQNHQFAKNNSETKTSEIMGFPKNKLHTPPCLIVGGRCERVGVGGGLNDFWEKNLQFQFINTIVHHSIVYRNKIC